MVMWQHQCNQSWRDHTYLYFYFFLTKTAVKSKWNKQISYFREMYISRNLLTSSSQQWWSHQCLPGMTRDIWMRLAGPSSSSSSWTIINSYFSYPANWISYYFVNKVGKCCWTGHCIFLVFSTVFLGPVNMIHCVIKRVGMLAWNDTRHLNAVGQHGWKKWFFSSGNPDFPKYFSNILEYFLGIFEVLFGIINRGLF